MTLLEILTAMAVAIVAVGILLALYGGIRRTMSSQAEWRSFGMPAGAAVDRIAADIACAFDPGLPGADAFVLRPASTADLGEGMGELCFFSTLPAPGRAPDKIHDAIAVRYYIEQAQGGSAIVREMSRLFGEAGSEISERLSPPVRGFSAMALGDSGWTNCWSASERECLPRAMRIALDVGGGRKPTRIEADIPISAGRQLTPDVSVNPSGE